jgi:hypothetical protein
MSTELKSATEPFGLSITKRVKVEKARAKKPGETDGRDQE